MPGADPPDDSGVVGCPNCHAVTAPGPWCLRCLRPLDATEVDAEVARSLRDARVVRVYSRTRSGALTFGLAGRLAWSVVPALAAFVAVRNVYRSLGDVTLAFYLVMAAPVLCLTGYFLSQVWQRDRVD